MSEALRLAQRLEILVTNEQDHQAAAAELRRLHEAHDWQYKMAGERLRRIEKLEALNAELVEALHQIRAHTLYSPTGAVHLIASAALAKAGENK